MTQSFYSFILYYILLFYKIILTKWELTLLLLW